VHLSEISRVCLGFLTHMSLARLSILFLYIAIHSALFRICRPVSLGEKHRVKHARTPLIRYVKFLHTVHSQQMPQPGIPSHDLS